MSGMSHFICMIASLVLTATMAGEQAKPSPGKAALQGTWAITSINGRRPPKVRRN